MQVEDSELNGGLEVLLVLFSFCFLLESGRG